MNSLGSFLRGEASRGDEPRVFDWVRAAELIKELAPAEAEAGLSEDWGYTGGLIWENGRTVPEDDTYVYLSSTWATPVLRVPSAHGFEEIACWRMAHELPDWDAHSYWPDAARAIVGAPLEDTPHD